MTEDTTKPLDKVIRIDESEIRGHLNELVRGTVEETLNELLDAEADAMCGAQRDERSPDRVALSMTDVSPPAGRMAESAALLADDVLPRLPMSQWVLGFPSPPRSGSCVRAGSRS